jgi:lipid A 3-O-deacylase
MRNIQQKDIRLMVACTFAAFAGTVQAIDLTPKGAYAMAGFAPHDTRSIAGGVIWPWSWRRDASGGEWTGLTEGYVAVWRARDVTGHQSLAQVGLVPLVRYRSSQGWFAEGGIGISFTNKLYVTPDKQFSTRFNFVDTLGAGYAFGPQRKHELGFRITHMSNASIKRPNPGENFLQLRYAVMF